MRWPDDLLTYELFDAGISTAQLLLALATAGGGGAVVGLAGSIARLRTDTRRELYGLIAHGRLRVAELSNDTTLEVAAMALNLDLETNQLLVDDTTLPTDVRSVIARSLDMQALTETVAVLPMSDRFRWDAYVISMSPFLAAGTRIRNAAIAIEIAKNQVHINPYEIEDRTEHKKELSEAISCITGERYETSALIADSARVQNDYTRYLLRRMRVNPLSNLVLRAQNVGILVRHTWRWVTRGSGKTR